MQNWEYRIVVVDIDWDDESDKPNGIDKGRLNQLGNEGWELVGIAPVNGPLEDGSNCTVEIQYLFKRPKPAEVSKQVTSKQTARKSTPITPEAASRIQSAAAKKAAANGKR
jgi:hypothetical protein